LAGKTELQRVGKACDAFYEFASTRINSEDDLVKVMNLIENMKIELPCNETSPRIVEEDCSAQNQATILDPKLARSKGRPPSKRKTSIVDQIVKKKLAKKKTKKSNQNSKNIQVQEEVSMKFIVFIDIIGIIVEMSNLRIFMAGPMYI